MGELQDGGSDQHTRNAEKGERNNRTRQVKGILCLFQRRLRLAATCRQMTEGSWGRERASELSPGDVGAHESHRDAHALDPCLVPAWQAKPVPTANVFNLSDRLA